MSRNIDGNKLIGVRIFLLMIALVVPSALAKDRHNPNWPSFRGWNAAGVSDGHKLPTTWNVETSKNIRWKTAIPGLAHSSPIVWGDRVFVTSAVSADANPYLRVGLYGASPEHPEEIEHEFNLYCLDKHTGKILWQRTAHKGIPKVKRHIKATHANSTPATDGKHVVAFFGSEGLYAYDFDGKLLWKKDFGLLDAGPFNAPGLQWGSASSPIIHDNRVIVQCDARNQQFLASLDIADGREVWRTTRDDNPTWSTPTIHASAGRTQVIANGYKHIGGYDFTTGKELWKLKGGGDIPTPTPIIAHDLIYITNAHGPMRPLYAIKTTATGDISLAEGESRNSHIAWSYARRGVYMQTPIVYGDYLYTCRGNGTMTCYSAKDGKIRYTRRLGSGSTGYTASPVAGDGKVFFVSEEGDFSVVKAGKKFELLATNPMGEICMATPAISEDALYVRGRHHLFCIGK